MRSYAREVAFCKVYTYLMCEEFDEDFSQFDTKVLSEQDLDFALSLVRGVIEKNPNWTNRLAIFRAHTNCREFTVRI